MSEQAEEKGACREIPSLVSRLSGEGKGFGYLTWEWAQQKPDKVAVICDGTSRTYGRLEERISGLAKALGKLGLSRESRAAIVLPNCIEYLEIEFACARVGITIVKINWRLSLPEIRELLAWNDVELVFSRRDLPGISWETDSDLGLGFFLVDVTGEAFAEMAEGGAAGESEETAKARDGKETREIRSAGAGGRTGLRAYVPAEVPDSILMHLHTSGTTGTPKCVIYTQESLLAELDLCRKALGFSKDTVFQVMSQLYHAASIGPYTCLSLGGTLVMFQRFQPKEYLRSIGRYKVTRLSAIPTVLRAILDEPELEHSDLSSLKTVYYSTCPIPPGLIRQARRALGCDFVQSYGMTEMGSIVTILGPEDHRQEGVRLHSAGCPLDGCQVRIVDPEDRDRARGQTGEILLRGPGRMRGYYKMEEATRQALRGGWYHTGDIGWLDEDGYLYLTGRKSDLIISGGENIYPKEIEDVLGECPGVRESAVYGVPHGYWGEAVHASVIPRTGVHLTGEELREFCQGRLAGYKIPKEFFFREEFPRNATGKVLKRVLVQEETGKTEAERTTI
ncbi:MAG: long-chain fatty acid--CoA ligase [Lachnospiraceae bacterium]|nr:long-chain fatty acid--CoA ligase [Lachnospiraceae bacterium]